MAQIHNLGFPRIGKHRELKKTLEAFWKGNVTASVLEEQGQNIRKNNLLLQKNLNWVPVNDFSFYDQVLDTSILLGNIPKHYHELEGTSLDLYFRMARGRSACDTGNGCCHAQEMTKWFDTNYHYLVPEFTHNTEFTPNTQKLKHEIEQAQSLGVQPKVVLVGPITYLKIGKEKDDSLRIDLFPKIVKAYAQILKELVALGVEWVQMDEPILVTELESSWQNALRFAYDELSGCGAKILLATYFGELRENADLLLSLKVDGIHIDGVRGKSEVYALSHRIQAHQVFSVGVVDGRNIWKSDLSAILDFLEPIHSRLGNRLWVAPSCSLLHVPVSLEGEEKLDAEIKNWLAFAEEKLVEIDVLGWALNLGRENVNLELTENQKAIESRKKSNKVHLPHIKEAVQNLSIALEERISPYATRAQIQQKRFNLPVYPTTTIGSFPQTPEIRRARAQFKKGELDTASYVLAMQREIAYAVQIQEELGIDVLVHGEAERNDMVEYFGEQLNGFVFSELGWVQSYGSRCVKPPILFGDIFRPQAMTTEWSTYAQSLTQKPMKGMLTGPVTILNWSFVRDDQPRSETCAQIALAIRDEVLDLEKAGIGIIQIDEAALREGLPLRKSEWQNYLDWAVGAFKVSANGVQDQTQIHTHMCYSEFNDIIKAIAHMDADVITIETSRSQMELLDVFDEFNYPNQIGPGVYDIHSPNIPTSHSVVKLMKLAAQKIPPERLWINPDCGLKTRQWAEVLPALGQMMDAAKELRQI